MRKERIASLSAQEIESASEVVAAARWRHCFQLAGNGDGEAVVGWETHLKEFIAIRRRRVWGFFSPRREQVGDRGKECCQFEQIGTRSTELLYYAVLGRRRRRRLCLLDGLNVLSRCSSPVRPAVPPHIVVVL